jgi:hypothetical protein
MASNINQYEEIVRKLLNKTLEKKVEWIGTYDSATFIAIVDSGFSFEVTNSRGGPRSTSYCKVTMKDSDDYTVFELQANPVSEETSTANDARWDLLKSLWDEARTVALGLDEKISHVNDILDKL